MSDMTKTNHVPKTKLLPENGGDADKLALIYGQRTNFFKRNGKKMSLVMFFYISLQSETFDDTMGMGSRLDDDKPVFPVCQ